MEWERLAADEFDLAATLNSGQVFHWHQWEGVWFGLIGALPVWLRQDLDGSLWVSAGGLEAARQYLGLDHDLSVIRKTLPKRDPHLKRALKYAPGLRIMKQPYWECLATFITSSMKQVAHIRQISLKLRERYGEKVAVEDGEHFAYPTPTALAAAGEEALRQCGLGYRAAFLHQSAARIASGEFDLEAVCALDDDDEAIAKLCELPGVGPKIAQCTLLFGYGRLGMFPIDVWIERALRELYFAAAETPPTAGELRLFARDHFGKYRGYAQQWLFHHARTGGGVQPRRRGKEIDSRPAGGIV